MVLEYSTDEHRPGSTGSKLRGMGRMRTRTGPWGVVEVVGRLLLGIAARRVSEKTA